MTAVFGGKVVPPKQQKEIDGACLDQDRRADRRVSQGDSAIYDIVKRPKAD
jgi:hypothetical protein